MRIIRTRLIWPVLFLSPLLLLGSCKSPQNNVSEAFHFKFHLEELNATTERFMFDRECDTDVDGNIVNVTERQAISETGAAAVMNSGDASISQCAQRWVAQFDATTRAASKVEFTSGDRSRTSNRMTAQASIGGIANPLADRFVVPGVGRLTAVTLDITGPIRNAAGTALWVQCAAQLSFQENDTTSPRSVFEAGINDYCEMKYTIFDAAGGVAGGQFKMIAKNVEDSSDSRLLVIPDGALTLSFD